MRLLIAGSSGWVGTHLASRLLADGGEIVGVDSRPNTWSRGVASRTRVADISLPRSPVQRSLAEVAGENTLAPLPRAQRWAKGWERNHSETDAAVSVAPVAAAPAYKTAPRGA